MNLVNASSEFPPATAALIRIYRDKVALNGPAMQLLGLTAKPCYISIKKDEESQPPRPFIGRCENASGFMVRLRGGGGRGGFINSRRLCRYLSGILQGPGCYRICGECPVCVQTFSGTSTYYEILFRKYSQNK